MNLFAYLRVGPGGSIYLPAEFREQIGLADAPAYIEARLAVDGVIALGPVVLGDIPPRTFGQHTGLEVPQPLEEPLPSNELAEWEANRDLVDHEIRDPWRDVPETAGEEVASRPVGSDRPLAEGDSLDVLSGADWSAVAEWYVDVESDHVVVRFRSAWVRHDHDLTVEQAWLLANELRAACLAVTGALGDRDAARAALRDYTTRSARALGIDADTHQVYEPDLDAGYGQLAAELSAESAEDPTGADQEASPLPRRGYEVRDYRDAEEGGPRLEVWLAGWLWPVVRAVKYTGGWLVLVDSKVAELAGVGGVSLTGLRASNGDEAMKWVELLAALYVKAVGK